MYALPIFISILVGLRLRWDFVKKKIPVNHLRQTEVSVHSAVQDVSGVGPKPLAIEDAR